MPTEQELVARAREGDERAFEQLVADNEKRVYNLCRRLAGNPEDGAEPVSYTHLTLPTIYSV